MKRKKDRNGNWQYVKHRHRKMSIERRITENVETGEMELQKLEEEGILRTCCREINGIQSFLFNLRTKTSF